MFSPIERWPLSMFSEDYLRDYVSDRRSLKQQEGEPNLLLKVS